MAKKKQKKQPEGDYEVGYGRPPKKHQFRKGTSGNRDGRPKSTTVSSTDISELLNQPVKVRKGKAVHNMQPFEVILRRLVKKALAGHLPSTRKFVRLCEEYGVIQQDSDEGGGLIIAPPGVDLHEWLESVTEEVPIDDEQS